MNQDQDVDQEVKRIFKSIFVRLDAFKVECFASSLAREPLVVASSGTSK